MQFSSTFIKLSGSVPEVKKSGLINDWENNFTYCKEFEQSEVLENKLSLFQIQLGGLGGSVTPEKFCSFSISLNCHKIVMQI